MRTQNRSSHPAPLIALLGCAMLTSLGLELPGEEVKVIQEVRVGKARRSPVPMSLAHSSAPIAMATQSDIEIGRTR
ncbi:MAG: hypothetical protein ACLQIB_07820 [Isosphaeraceae bacterium]